MSQVYQQAHVRGALHLDSSAFTDAAAVDALVQSMGSASKVAVHCGGSQHRGPKSAAALAARLKVTGVDKEVHVMEGGFVAFSQQFGGLVEGEAAK
jgi:rhodanese-related sulfurtransferase